VFFQLYASNAVIHSDFVITIFHFIILLTRLFSPIIIYFLAVQFCKNYYYIFQIARLSYILLYSVGDVQFVIPVITILYNEYNHFYIDASLEGSKKITINLIARTFFLIFLDKCYFWEGICSSGLTIALVFWSFLLMEDTGVP